MTHREEMQGESNDLRRWWHAALDELWKAEYTARRLEMERNEGDADAIRRDAIRTILGLGIGDEMYPTREQQEKKRGL